MIDEQANYEIDCLLQLNQLLRKDNERLREMVARYADIASREQNGFLQDCMLNEQYDKASVPGIP